ncbi:hypothetical protein LRP49_06025 [Enterovibrio sp. ZSDZ35]|uniref:Uncharacterized protein n=1 Tax=Enterovibrio qingdaonensis TaxID=2899818 RepID=A0ABT5QIF0_9GAMM|nr:hypothetical protein [Enterovibrio sp. ZSDZ35]MDD1780759.1 hypothetical protein [Enterovibrio sp. ZSDZ35]
MLESNYIKHPLNCEKCNALTPHIELPQEESASVDGDKNKTQYIMSFFSSDETSPIASYDDDVAKYKCEKCGTVSQQ